MLQVIGWNIFSLKEKCFYMWKQNQQIDILNSSTGNMLRLYNEMETDEEKILPKMGKEECTEDSGVRPKKDIRTILP